MKCRDCNHTKFMKGNGNPNRYYCTHPEAGKEVGSSARMICRTERHSEEMTTKTSPRWCPLRGEKK